MSDGNGSGVIVSMDDPRIAYFASRHPEVTHAAMLHLRDLLQGAEEAGRDTAAAKLTGEIEARAQALVKDRTEELTEWLRTCDWAARELSQLVGSVEAARKRNEERRAAKAKKDTP